MKKITKTAVQEMAAKHDCDFDYCRSGGGYYYFSPQKPGVFKAGTEEGVYGILKLSDLTLEGWEKELLSRLETTNKGGMEMGTKTKEKDPEVKKVDMKYAIPEASAKLVKGMANCIDNMLYHGEKDERQYDLQTIKNFAIHIMRECDELMKKHDGVPIKGESKVVDELMAEGRRYALYVDELDYINGEGYAVRLVFEKKAGYFPMDYRWGSGRDLKAARKIAEKKNALRGIDNREADKIVASSMFAN